MLIVLLSVQRVDAEMGCLGDNNTFYEYCTTSNRAIVGKTLKDARAAWDYWMSGRFKDLQQLVDNDSIIKLTRPLKVHIISKAFKPTYKVRVYITLTEVWIHCSQLDCVKKSSEKGGAESDTQSQPERR